MPPLRSLEVALVFGTRPEIIKLSSLPAALAELGVRCRLVHTGQHYDDALDGAFFRELGLPAPDVNLRVGSDDGGRQVRWMVDALGRVFGAARPDWVVVQGDTNSTLAGAVAARRAGVPLAHLEAGLRCGDLSMQEERNRIAVDRLSDLLFAPTPLQARFLRRGGAPGGRIHVVGNTIADAVRVRRGGGFADAQVARDLELARDGYAVMTLHRQANVDDAGRLSGILRGVACAADEHALPVVWPLHPRSEARLRAAGIALPPGVIGVPPIGYRQCLALQAAARLVLTDSGGLQEEACILGVPCVTLRESTERQETVAVGANRLGGVTPDSIPVAVRQALCGGRVWRDPYGVGDTAKQVARAIASYGASGASGRSAELAPVLITVPI